MIVAADVAVLSHDLAPCGAHDFVRVNEVMAVAHIAVRFLGVAAAHFRPLLIVQTIPQSGDKCACDFACGHCDSFRGSVR
jgi:hypothetical protein